MEKDTSPEQTEERGDREDLPGGDVEVIDHGPAKKNFRPSRVSVTIREAESHYLVSFGCGPTRVFHNREELLIAIEVEVKRLGGTLAGG